MAEKATFTKFGAIARRSRRGGWTIDWPTPRRLLAADRPATADRDWRFYAVEIRLKVLICRRLELTALPKAFEIHDLEALARAGRVDAASSG